MARRKPAKRPDLSEAKPNDLLPSEENSEEDVVPMPETPQEKQCRALLQGSPTEQKIAETIYEAEMVRRIRREIENEK